MKPYKNKKTFPLHGDVLTRQPDTRVSDKDIPYNRTKLSATSSKYSCLILKIKKVGQYVKWSKFIWNVMTYLHEKLLEILGLTSTTFWPKHTKDKCWHWARNLTRHAGIFLGGRGHQGAACIPWFKAPGSPLVGNIFHMTYISFLWILVSYVMSLGNISYN